MNIIEAFEDKKLFGSLVKDQRTWANWKVALKAIFGLSMSKKETNIYRTFTGRNKAPESQAKEVFAIVGRRGGKSFISAVIVCYLALFHDWRKYLSPGERGYVMCIASDRKQAGVVLGYIRAILQLPIFKKKVLNETREEIELTNQITISIVTCSYRALRGYTVLAAICDEIAFWRVEGANPAKEILTALRPALATIPDSLLIGISTPYSRAGVLYEQFKKHYGKSGGPLIWKAATERMNPTIDQEIIKTALKEDPAAAKSEWKSEFRSDISAFMPPEFIEAVTIPGRYELPKAEGVKYYGFADPSGGRQDSFTLGVAHKNQDKKIILDVLREQRPPFQPSAVVKEFSQTLKAYGIDQIESDLYAGEWVTESFRDHGIQVKNSEHSASELYLSFLPLVANGTVELLDSKRLKTQLAGLERRTRSGGKDSITHFPGSHDDVANACAGVCVMAARGPGLEPRIRSLGGPEISCHGKSKFSALSNEDLDREIEKIEKELERNEGKTEGT